MIFSFQESEVVALLFMFLMGNGMRHLLHKHEDLRAEFHQALGSELSAKVLALRGNGARGSHADAGTMA